MFIVENSNKGNGNGYTITLKHPGTRTRALKVEAVNLDEVSQALYHYHLKPHIKEKCPLCKRAQEKKQSTLRIRAQEESA